MNWPELENFIALQGDRLRAQYSCDDEEKWALAQAVKLSEEVGELCEATLSAMGFQRKEKLDIASREHLESEVADVLITTLLLAKTTGVDIKQALANKMAKINARYPTSA